jgi:hypothetical protein
MKPCDPKSLGDFLDDRIAKADGIRPEDVTMEYIMEQRRIRESQDDYLSGEQDRRIAIGKVRLGFAA